MWNIVCYQENANSEGLKLKQLIEGSIGEYVKELGPSYIAVTNAKWYSHLRKQFDHLLKG